MVRLAIPDKIGVSGARCNARSGRRPPEGGAENTSQGLLFRRLPPALLKPVAQEDQVGGILLAVRVGSHAPTDVGDYNLARS